MNNKHSSQNAKYPKLKYCGNQTIISYVIYIYLPSCLKYMNAFDILEVLSISLRYNNQRHRDRNNDQH